MSKTKYTIEDMQNIALKRGGWCSSQKHLGLNSKLWWQCENGHMWNVAPSGIIYSDNWCPYCAGRRKQIRNFIFKDDYFSN